MLAFSLRKKSCEKKSREKFLISYGKQGWGESGECGNYGREVEDRRRGGVGRER